MDIILILLAFTTLVNLGLIIYLAGGIDKLRAEFEKHKEHNHSRD